MRLALRSMFRAAVAATVALPVLAASAPRVAASPTVPQPHGGFATAYTLLYEPQADLDRDLTFMADAHAKWIRFDMAWSVVERTKGVYDWTTIDRLVNSAKARRFKLLATLAYTPVWARAAGTDDKTAPTTPDQRAAFGAFARAAATRYGAQINAWEMWNEENAVPFWKPVPDVAGYAALLHEGSQGVRSVIPDANILLGGLAAVGTGGGSVEPETFLHALYDAGVGPDITAVAVHVTSYPYAPDDPTTAAWNVMLRIPRIHDFMASRGDGGKRVWVTEYGAPTSGQYAVTEERQAAFVVDAFGQMARYGTIAGPLFWYTPRDKGTDAGAVDQNYGIVRRDWSHKQSFTTFATLFNGTGKVLADYLAGQSWLADLPPGAPTDGWTDVEASPSDG